MSTYAALRVHLVFATKGRQPTIAGEWRGRLHAYVGGCLKTLECVPEAVGGTADHIHVLASYKTKHSVAELVRELKKATNSWLQTQMGQRNFAWQEGYAAISVSPRDKLLICNYIANQEEHHREVDALDELRRILIDAKIEYDAAYFV